MTERAAPAHLSLESRRLWRETVRTYDLEARHEKILMVALEALDRMREAQAAVKADGAYVVGRFGMKSHPGLAVERDSRLAFLRAVRELGLDLEAPASRLPTPWRQ
ncbi:MAG: P27 family phage terminase small subunit [Candidatus Limnocylindrales bacterium]